MKHVLSTLELVGGIALPDGVREVCAGCEVDFDEENSELRVALRAFLRPEGNQRPGWLPADQVVRDHVAWQDALPAAREMFRNWVPKIRAAWLEQPAKRRLEDYDLKISH